MYEVSDNVKHVPFVPRLRFFVSVSVSSVAVAILGFFQCVPDDERVQRRIAQRIGFVDELPQSMVEQELGRLKRILG